MQSLKILVAEDESLILKTIELKLKKEGYQVFGCADGKTAMKTISEELPDLVITDMMLPYVSGLELVTAVKAMDQKKIPVIILSGLGQESTVEEAFRVGADDYITKPFSLSELSMRIKKLINVTDAAIALNA